MNKNQVSRVAIFFSIFLSIIIIAAYLLPDIFYHLKNRSDLYGQPTLNTEVMKQFDQLHPIDLHADLLLWNRDIVGPNWRGHLDLKKLIQAKFRISVFSTVTKIPKNRNYFSNPDDSDILPMLMIAQRWPKETWYNPLERAFYQANKLKLAIQQTQNQVYLISNAKQIREKQNQLGILLATEGMNLINGDLENAQHLYDSGFRIFGLTHFTDNAVGGSAHGEHKMGLTSFGRELLSFAKNHHVIIDLAHASENLVSDVLLQYDGPTIVSHTGIQGTCPSPRNLSDEQIRLIAKNKGLIGIAFFPEAICDYTVKGIVDSMEYVEKLVGLDVLALGSDYEGSVKTKFDILGLPYLVQEMINRGWTQNKIEKVIFKNAEEFFLRSL